MSAKKPIRDLLVSVLCLICRIARTFIVFGQARHIAHSTTQCQKFFMGRTRPMENQILDKKFYMKEHTKTFIFKSGILTFGNLYNYHNMCLEILKVTSLLI